MRGNEDLLPSCGGTTRSRAASCAPTARTRHWAHRSGRVEEGPRRVTHSDSVLGVGLRIACRAQADRAADARGGWSAEDCHKGAVRARSHLGRRDARQRYRLRSIRVLSSQHRVSSAGGEWISWGCLVFHNYHSDNFEEGRGEVRRTAIREQSGTSPPGWDDRKLSASRISPPYETGRGAGVARRICYREQRREGMRTFFRLVVAQQEVVQPARQRLGRRSTGRIGRVESRRVRADSRTATACSASGREWRVGLWSAEDRVDLFSLDFLFSGG